jgi:hypothetical protein
MIFHIALLLTKGLIAQPRKCSRGLVLMEFTGFAMFPPIQKQLD